MIAPMSSPRAFRIIARGSRRGMGTILVVACLFIAVLAVMQYAQSFLMSQVSDQTTRLSVGRLCAQYAESALEEAHKIALQRANKPGPLFDAVRGFAAGGTQSFTLALSELPNTQAMLATEQGKSFEIGPGVQVTFRHEDLLAISYPIEYEGRIVLQAAVGWKTDRTVVRNVGVASGYKVVHVTLPAAFTKYPLVVNDPHRVVTGKHPGDSSGPQGIDVNQLIPALLGTATGMASKNSELIRKLGEANDGYADRIKAVYQGIQSDPAAGGVNHFQAVATLGSAFRPFPPIDPAAPYHFFCNTPAADLNGLNLQGQLIPRLKVRDAMEGPMAALARECDQLIQDQNKTEEHYQKHVMLAGNIKTVLRLFGEMILAANYFRDHMQIVDRSSAATYDALRPMFGLVDPMQMGSTASMLGLRATHTIREMTPGVPGYLSLENQWNRLRQRMGGDTGFYGIVYVENDREVFPLRGEVAGNLTIAVRGPVLIEDLKTKFAQDCLTVIALGGASGKVAVKGQVAASLVARAASLGIDPGARIQGSLVLDELSISGAPLLAGQVAVDPFLADASRPGLRFLVCSPWATARWSDRSR